MGIYCTAKIDFLRSTTNHIQSGDIPENDEAWVTSSLAEPAKEPQSQNMDVRLRAPSPTSKLPAQPHHPALPSPFTNTPLPLYPRWPQPPNHQPRSSSHPTTLFHPSSPSNPSPQPAPRNSNPGRPSSNPTAGTTASSPSRSSTPYPRPYSTTPH